MKTITISVAGPQDEYPGTFTVQQDGKYHEGLTWGEMHEQVIYLTISDDLIRRRGYPMKTAEEWAEQKRQREERYIAREAATLPNDAPQTDDDISF